MSIKRRFAPETYGEDEGESWQKDAACRGMDPELFFDDTLDGVEAAKKVCRKCPVRQECLQYVLSISTSTSSDGGGVWGETSWDDRKSYRQQKRAQARRKAKKDESSAA